MQRPFRRLVGACLSLIALAASAVAGNWPQWRGPTGDGVSTETGLPLAWGESRNVVWKCALPGAGASTPAVWGDAIFVTCQEGDRLLLLKIDKAAGQVAWTRQVGTGVPRRGAPGDDRHRQKFHALHNMASPSPVTDGERVIAHFGNGDLAAYDFAGRQLWHHNLQSDFGTYTIWWGHANSPVLYGDLVISVCMQDSLADLQGHPVESYLVAHDKRTGAVRWKTARMTGASAESNDAYTTPILYQGPDGPELVVMGGNQIDAYDLATGRQRWVLPGIPGGRTITGPTTAGGLIYATQGMRGPLLAIRPQGSGKLSAEAVVWRQKQGTPDTPCPVAWNGLLFWITDNGIAHCCDARTGALHWKERLPGDYKASPVIAEGRVYFLNVAGLCTVVAAAPSFEKLAANQVADRTFASPAIADGRLYLRGDRALFCIGAR